ncbi:MAG: RIP metalloprotease RseP [Candidatus Magasanikbacteria bacterium CG_4_10_14_0_2_um_filter_37_12]|uniref:Zinc metalloprotease n=1 Tax=Candidatus Magasanikbacteria bacterium CG_4_10_14_0_2_um_filter_37_12 TaxID=1974637 RepID=A0A2M7V9E6_9BACT|nr:MAG: RIP metalloprotease RseP [Candidatus Magasanikbacteria bacterium CG_4_10_14_0_2_um_filter_37_12]
MMTVILFIFILGLLVFVHEFGHFIVARKSGMKVYEFGFGFPPRACGFYKDLKTGKIVWVKKKDKELRKKEKESTLANTVGGEEREEEYSATVYSINWLPLGGFVKIKGENGEKASEPDSFGYHKFWKKALVLVAGVTMNFLLAVVLLSVGFMIGLPADAESMTDPKAIVVEEPFVTAQQIEEGSPADLAGILFGDKILFVDGVQIVDASQLVSLVNERANQDVTVDIERVGERVSLSMTPVQLEGENTARLGISVVETGKIRYPWYLAIYRGFIGAVITTIHIFLAFVVLIKNLILGQGLAFDVSGPVGIAVIVGESARLGLAYLINITAMLSLSLAVINILPIPALDGGRLLFVTIEKIFKRPIPLKYEQIAHTVGFVLLMALIVVVTWRDVAGLFE